MQSTGSLWYNRDMNKETFKGTWNDLKEIFEDRENCDEFTPNDQKDETVLMVLNGVLDEDLDPNDPKVKEFLDEVRWGMSEFYNSEYAPESPGLRSDHRKGYKESKKKSKELLRAILKVK